MLIKRFFSFILAILLWVLEVLARFIWLLTPIGIHMLFLQLRKNVDRLPALTGYFDPDSTWQMIYDGVVLVNTNPGALQKRFNTVKTWFIKTKWFWLVLSVLSITISLVCIVYKLH